VIYQVRIGAELSLKITGEFPEERSAAGGPSEYDFVSGPLAAALVAFSYFENLPEETGPSIRSYHTADPVFGAVVFVGVLLPGDQVEVADFGFDPDYWEQVNDFSDE
jgi:hypothetical protein